MTMFNVKYLRLDDIVKKRSNYATLSLLIIRRLDFLFFVVKTQLWGCLTEFDAVFAKAVAGFAFGSVSLVHLRTNINISINTAMIIK